MVASYDKGCGFVSFVIFAEHIKTDAKVVLAGLVAGERKKVEAHGSQIRKLKENASMG